VQNKEVKVLRLQPLKGAAERRKKSDIKAEWNAGTGDAITGLGGQKKNQDLYLGENEDLTKKNKTLASRGLIASSSGDSQGWCSNTKI